MREYYQELDNLLKESEWVEIDRLLQNSPPDKTNLNKILALLIFSVKCKGKLKFRADYLETVRNYLNDRGMNSEEILLNL